jgi:hypothetical protein
MCSFFPYSGGETITVYQHVKEHRQPLVDSAKILNPVSDLQVFPQKSVLDLNG